MFACRRRSTGANAGANFSDADVNSAKLLSLRGSETAINFESSA
jgi:hypothetical protein